MPKVIDKSTGQTVDVPDESAAVSGIMSGRYRALPKENYVANVRGRAGVVSGEELEGLTPLGVVSPRDPAKLAHEAVKAGRREDATSLRGRVVGVGTTAVSAATLGAFPAAVKASGGDLSAQRDFEEFNPLLATGAAVAGSLLPGTPAGALFSKATKAGQAVGKGSKVAGLATTGAIEGAGFGVGQQISNMAVHDVPFSSSVLLEQAGIGALLGGGGALVGKAFGKLRRKGNVSGPLDLASPAAKEIRTGFNDNFTRISKVQKSIDDDLLHGVTKIDDELVSGVKQHHDNLVDISNQYQLSAAIRNKMVPFRESIIRLENRIASGKNVDAAWDSVTSAARRLDDKLQDIGPVNAETGLVNHVFNRELDHLADLIQLHPELTGSKSLFKSVKPSFPKATAAVKKSKEELMASLGGREISADALIRVIQKAAKNKGEGLAKVSQSYQKYIDDLDALKSKYLQSTDEAVIQRGMKIGEDLDDIKAHMSDVVGRAFPEGFDREQVMAAAGVLGVGELALPELDGPGDDILKLGLAAMTFRALRKSSGAPEGLRRFADNTARVGFGRGVAQKAQPISNAVGGVGGSVVNAATFQAGSFAGMGILKTLTGRTNVAAQGMGRKLRKAFGAGGKFVRKVGPLTAAKVLANTQLGIQSKKEQPDDIKRLQYEVSALVSSPDLLARITEAMQPIGAQSLQVMDELSNQVYTSLQFLNQVFPKDPGTLMKMGKSTWVTPPSEVQKAGHTLIGLFHPSVAIDMFTQGKVTPELAQAFRIGNPGYFAKLQEHFAENLEEIRKYSTLQQRISISLMFGIPTDPTMQMGMMLQDNFFDAAVEQAQQPAQPSNLKTPAQELTS